MSKKWFVEGDVVVRDGTGAMTQRYQADFVLDVTDEALARSVIRRGLITEHLRKTVDGFKRVRTLTVVGSENSSEAVGEYEKTVAKAAKLGALPENLDGYGTKENKQRVVENQIKKVEAKKAKPKDAPATDAYGVTDEGYID